MIDVKWNDNAKAAVDYFADWLRADYNYIANLEDFYRRLPQTKTVADAVTGKQIDISEMREGMTVKCVRAGSGCYKVGGRYAVGRDKDGYFGPLNEKGLASFNHKAYNFELVEEPEQEGEKWTHVDAFGNPCRILIDELDSNGNVIIIRQDGWYSPVAASSIKPIKPTLSKSEAWDKVASEDLELSVSVSAIKQQYNII